MCTAMCDINHRAKRIVLGAEKQLSDENVGLKYLIWLLHNNDGQCDSLSH